MSHSSAADGPSPRRCALQRSRSSRRRGPTGKRVGVGEGEGISRLRELPGGVLLYIPRVCRGGVIGPP